MPQRPDEGVRCPGTEVTDSCEPPCRFWEVNPGTLQEQPGLFTTEPSLRPQGPGFKVVCCCSLDWQNQLAGKINKQGRALGGGEISLSPKCKARMIPGASQQLSRRPPLRKAGLLKVHADSRFVPNKRRTEIKCTMLMPVFQGPFRQVRLWQPHWHSHCALIFQVWKTGGSVVHERLCVLFWNSVHLYIWLFQLHGGTLFPYHGELCLLNSKFNAFSLICLLRIYWRRPRTNQSSSAAEDFPWLVTPSV